MGLGGSTLYSIQFKQLPSSISQVCVFGLQEEEAVHLSLVISKLIAHEAQLFPVTIRKKNIQGHFQASSLLVWTQLGHKDSILNKQELPNSFLTAKNEGQPSFEKYFQTCSVSPSVSMRVILGQL